MTDPERTQLGPAGPEIDDEPLLVRPYVLVHQPTEIIGTPPPPGGEPEPDGPPAATPGGTGPAPSRRRSRRARARHNSAARRGRRRLLSAGSGALILLLGTTALVLAAGDRPASPAADVHGPVAPQGGQFPTGAGQVPPPEPASNPPSTAAASPLSGPPPGSVPPPRPSDSTEPSGAPVLVDQPAPGQPPPPADARTGRITGASGLCLDGGSGSRTDRVRRLNCDGGASQTWTVPGDGSIQTVTRCLQASGSQVALQICNGDPVQQWRPGSAGSLVNSASGLCLTGVDGDEDSRSSTRMTTCNQSDAQRWTLP